jgi:O-antigen/teichoic acid export membrane protein
LTILNSSKANCHGPEKALALEHLTGGKLLARNTVLNVIGQVAPLVIAIFTVPLLIKGLGIDRYGVLTLAWMVIGYFGLFDLGIGRALTKFVAERLGTGQEEGIPPLVWTSLFLMLVLGMVGTVVIGMLSPWLVRRALTIPTGLQTETLYTFYILALTIPVVITTAGVRGVLEAKQRFGFLNALRIIMGGITYFVPLLVLFFSKSLLLIVVFLAVSRLLILVLHMVLCLHLIPALRLRIAFELGAVTSLLRFGGWITVSNIISPAMTYLDRFLIAAVVSIAYVSYYSAPYMIVTNLLVFPLAITGVLFPAFATSFVQDPKRTSLFFVRGVKYVFLVMFPIVLFIVAFARQGLDLWLGKEFAEHGTRVLQLLAIGIFFNSLAQIPFSLVQSAGRPDLTAKLHLIELPFYLIAVWWMTRTFGIEGTALVWAVRVIIDALILFRMAKGILPRSSYRYFNTEIKACLILLVFVLELIPKNIIFNLTFIIIAMILFVFVSWFIVLDSEERSIIHAGFKKGIGIFHRESVV